MPSPHYPVFLSLEGRVCLVAGGGSVGERKIRKLIECGASVRIAARDVTPWIGEQCDQGRAVLMGESYDESYLDGADLVFAATDDPVLNQQIASDARARRLWCNMASNPELGSFILPSVIHRGPLTIAVSTAGMSPAIAKQIREKLERQFGPGWSLSLQFMGALRSAVQAKELEGSENLRIFREVAALPLQEWFEGECREEALSAVHAVCRERLSLIELNRIWDEVWKPSSLSSQPCATSAEPSGT